MPGPLLLPLLGMGLSAVSQGANMLSQGAANRKNREFTEKMYNRQRQDSLSDWAMQNEYNSPQAQMERLRNANLNPNLVYGNGSVVANSQSMPRQASGQSYGHQPTQFNFQDSIAAFTDARVKQAQYDNLRTQQTIMLQDAIGKSLDNEKKTFDKGMREQLRQLSVDMAYKAKELQIARWENLNSSTDLNVDRNTRESEVHEQLTIPMIKDKLQQATEQVLTMQTNRALTEEQIKKVRAEIDQLEKSGKLKDFEIQLNKRGFTKSDPVWMRMGSKIAENLGISF